MLEYLWFLPLLILIIGLPYTYYKKGIRFCVAITYVVCVAIFMRLFHEAYGNEALLSSFVYAAQLFTFGVSGKELIEMLALVRSELSTIYIICVWTAYLLCPVLTVGALLSFIKKGLDRTTLKTRFFKKVYIFSEKNDSSLSLAKDICAKNRRAVVVFTEDDGNEEDNNMLFVSSTPYQVYSMLNQTNEVFLCFNDTETGKLLDKLHTFLEKKRKKKVDIFIFSNNPVAYEVIDSMKNDVQNACIKVISTNAILMRNILWDYPLYVNMHQKEELNVSVLGVGEFGGYFAMNTLWCSTMPDCSLKLNLVDCDSADNILSRVSNNIPEGYFDIEIFNDNINTNSFFAKLPNTRMQNSNYFLVSTGDDDVNIYIARKLRLYFARCGKHPFIIAVLKNQSRYMVMKKALKNEDIEITGGTGSIYNYDSIFEDRFFCRAFSVYKLVEKNYGHEATEEDFYKQKQIDIFSSYANAIHCKYKVYALCGHCGATEEEICQKLAEQTDKIIEAEHKRWVAFETLKGYIGVLPNHLSAFLEHNAQTGKIHKNEKLKMHACITDVKGVEEVDRLIEEKFGLKQNLTQIDELIAKQTATLWFMR